MNNELKIFKVNGFTRMLVLPIKIFRYFNKHKAIILSFLFCFSILKNYLWYSCFGINILKFSTFQDIFLDFFDDFASLLLIFFLFIIMINFKSTENNLGSKLFNFFFGLVILTAAFFYLTIFRMLMPVIPLLGFIAFFYFAYESKSYLPMLSYLFFFLFLYTFINPLVESSIQIKSNGKKTMYFLTKKSSTESFSFEYNNKLTTVNDSTNFLIGSNSTYIFLYNRIEKKSIIFPKNECKNIKTKTFFKN